ncbi:MAG: hypothetical protein M1818_000436 [Claussenomyces sp. TS43310]|nr:MAG: hypothetical protein M1818_000436 [Claussenomyces sp. TS43310]
MSYPSDIKDPLADFHMDGCGLSDGAPSPFNFVSPRYNGAPLFPSSHEGHVEDEVPLDPEKLKATMDTILEIFDLDESPILIDIDEDDDAPVDFEDRLQRTERLRRVAPALDQLWWNNSEYLAGAAERLADGSRDPRWRIPLGQTGLLNSFLQVIATEGVPHALMIHALRLIGNSCADTDENRGLVVAQNALPSIIALLKDTSLLPFAIPVLFNICIDYEPAQKQASENFLTRELIDLVRSPDFIESRTFLGYICKLLDMMIIQSPELENAPERTAAVLIVLAADREFLADLEDFLALITSALLYLQDVKFQQGLIRYPGGLESAQKALLYSYTRFEDTTLHGLPSETNHDDAAQLTLMRSNMNQALSDVSALPEFAAAYPVVSSFSSSLRRWLSSPQLQLQVCACIMLGNIARSDSACEAFVHTSQVHKVLITILKGTNDPQLLHATLGFLKNLALPAKNKAELGNAGLLQVLERLWTLDSQPQIQYSSISLVRQLLIGTFENVLRICVHLSSDPDSPAYFKDQLSIILDVFNKTDLEPTKMEVARLFTAIVRVYTSPNANIPNAEGKRQRFFERHPDIGRPIAFMVTQKKWPVVRSEGWFVMALMCRFPEGAHCVSDLMHDMNVFQPLAELLTGKSLVNGRPLTTSPVSSPPSDNPQHQQPPPSGADGMSQSSNTSPTTMPASPSSSDSRAAEMARIDRENALVLVTELMRHRSADMAPIRRSAFEELLKGGGIMHLSYAQVRAREDFYDGPNRPRRDDPGPKLGLGVNAIMQDTTEQFLG